MIQGWKAYLESSLKEVPIQMSEFALLKALAPRASAMHRYLDLLKGHQVTVQDCDILERLSYDLH